MLRKKLSEIRVELDFTKNTVMEETYKRLVKTYEFAIDTLESANDFPGSEYES